jgi:N-glycosylase/DNA lyase
VFKTCSTGSITDVEFAWFACADLYSDAVIKSPVRNARQVRAELLFCLVGGFGITYEHCRSVSARLNDLRIFDSDARDEVLEEQLVRELSQEQFEPRRLDGQLRRYRFPYRKANLIVRARNWLLDQGDLGAALVELESDHDRREFLCCCPGVGPKTASWLLRNLGMGANLAILDIHVIRALKAAGRVDEAHFPKDYKIVEGAFLAWCRELDALPAAFDLFLWEWQRGSLVRDL